MTHAGFRDAIHVPFIMVTCNEDLEPGTKVSLREDSGRCVRCVKWSGKPEDLGWPQNGYGTEPMWHGVADPYKEEAIKAGELFAVHIRRECFSSLRHDFRIEVHDTGGTATCHSVCDIE